MDRPSAFSGSFYTADAKALVKEIHQFLTASVVDKDVMEKAKTPLGFVVPHAGYVYSGLTAAHAYKVLKEVDCDTVILLGPSHHAYVEGNSVYPKGSFKTPLGSMKIDEKVAASLLKKMRMSDSLEPHFPEHSLEVQIPFLQTVKKDTKIVPILIGDYNLKNLEQLATNLLEILHEFSKKRILFLVSTDLSHYHSAEAADRMDNQFIGYFKDFKLKELIEGFNSNQLEACGSGPLIAFLLLAKTLKKTNVEILDHSNSGKTSGDQKRVVGYFSAVVY